MNSSSTFNYSLISQQLLLPSFCRVNSQVKVGSHRQNELVNIPLHVLTRKSELSHHVESYAILADLQVALPLRKGEKPLVEGSFCEKDKIRHGPDFWHGNFYFSRYLFLRAVYAGEMSAYMFYSFSIELITLFTHLHEMQVTDTFSVSVKKCMASV